MVLAAVMLSHVCDLLSCDLWQTGSSEEVRSGTSGENEEVALQLLHTSVGGATVLEQKPSTAASWVIYLFNAC